MQALCAMLRARRRDPTLAGLVFLALKACITEWGYACDAMGGVPDEQRRHQQYQRELQQREEQQSFGAIVARGRGWNGPGSTLGGAVETKATTNVTAAATPPPNSSASAYQALGANATVAGGAPSAGAATGQSEASAAFRFVGTQGAYRETRDASELMATPRGKMHLGIRESLKAGLVWAEAVPLFRIPAAGPEGCRRGTGAEQAAAASNVGTGDVSFDPAMAQAVERLCR